MATASIHDSTNFFDHALLMGALPFPGPSSPRPTPPEDTTHRFYRCVEIPTKKEVLECTKVLKEATLTTPTSHIITIKKGCPQAYDPLTISWKTGAAVRIVPPTG
jgi:hypothetical protein